MPLRPLLRAFPLVASLLAACAPPEPPAAPPAPVAAPPPPVVAPPVAAAPAPDPRVADPSRLHVLMINGGGKPEINYQTHLMHLKELRELLLGAGVAPDRMTILSSDGADPAPDLASRDGGPHPDLSFLIGTRQERAFAVPTVLINSEIPGVTLGVASKPALGAYFDRAATSLKAGDTLLLYVTDHGLKNSADPTNNSILLWKGEKLTVTDLGEMLDRLDPSVRVVGLMSQCFSGAFAGLATRGGGDGRARAPFCGYFSTTAHRPAYGCYPEDRSRERPGHSFQILYALGATRSLAEAHVETMLRDETPDAPMRTSDVYLDALLRKQAKQRGVPFEAFVDELLAAGAPGDATWQRDRAMADRIATAYGVGASRSFTDLTAHRQDLALLSKDLDTAARKWRTSWMELAKSNLTDFFMKRPDWNRRLGDTALPTLDPADARAMTKSFLADLAAGTRPDARARFAHYRERTGALGAASYRADVRAGASIRVRTLLATLAGRAYVASPSLGAAPDERAGWEAVRACEDLRLPGATTPLEAPPPPLPPLADDIAQSSQK